MTRRLRARCRACGDDVATLWAGDQRVAIAHQVAGRGKALCRGSGKAAVLPVGMRR